jgi:hypothetical protein
MASKPHPWKGEKMAEYGLSLRFYPPNTMDKATNLVYEVIKFEDGKATGFAEVIEIAVNMPEHLIVDAPGPQWMTWVLACALANQAASGDLCQRASESESVEHDVRALGILPVRY